MTINLTQLTIQNEKRQVKYFQTMHALVNAITIVLWKWEVEAGKLK